MSLGCILIIIYLAFALKRQRKIGLIRHMDRSFSAMASPLKIGGGRETVVPATPKKQTKESLISSESFAQLTPSGKIDFLHDATELSHEERIWSALQILLDEFVDLRDLIVDTLAHDSQMSD